jgi:hypothetical protein
VAYPRPESESENLARSSIDNQGDLFRLNFNPDPRSSTDADSKIASDKVKSLLNTLKHSLCAEQVILLQRYESGGRRTRGIGCADKSRCAERSHRDRDAPATIQSREEAIAPNEATEKASEGASRANLRDHRSRL